MKSLLFEKMSTHVKAIGADKKRQTRTQQEAIGAVLTELRVKRGWSQRKLADLLGYDQAYILQLERGLKRPTLRTLEVFARAFEMEVSDLVEAAERRIKR
jgi:transcriptional regulator with XRE-family HTH domain